MQSRDKCSRQRPADDQREAVPARSSIGRLLSDEHFRLLVETVEDYAIFLLDPAGNVATWNNGAKRIKGYEADEIMGRHFSVFYPPEDVAAGKPESELALAIEKGHIEDEGWRVRRDESRFWANVVITAVRDANGTLRGFAKVTRDMTDQLRLAELQHARELSTHVQTARENERTDIARELHDDLGQQLAALKMQLAALDMDVDATGLARHRVSQTQAMQGQIDTIIASVRRIAAGLRPPILDDLGLFAAIDWLVSDFRRRYGIDATLNNDTEALDFNASASTAIFRLIQEALTNIVRHAEASEVRIDIRRVDADCVLSIEDNGRGAALEADPGTKSFGLLGMRERVRQLRGTIAIDSTPGRGFRILTKLPVETIITGSAV
ncbi:PAS/PAC sensor signal transduction histidine kinase [Caballeronia terrestris]|uniref:PAS/PAC sensor signal transduction histidine kinase n=2 Tax=Caballeronia TaxID=1827195 RepID=A0A158L0K6_9BURK|nr:MULTISPECIES: PAS domain-containing sensor histidine kinase [Caballeronia]SAL62189.1 PAS/PAC sensor signal transduction histidine kinase [Caballeronia humi]SAL86904.1 PAS/PAC sensor signal transduction histidine kinase [Caballeronia terrestris]